MGSGSTHRGALQRPLDSAARLGPALAPRRVDGAAQCQVVSAEEVGAVFERATHVIPLRTLILAANVLKLSPPENIFTSICVTLCVQFAFAPATPSSPSSAVESSALAIVVENSL